MKKLFLGFAAVVLLFTACVNDSKDLTQEQEIDMSDFYLHADVLDDNVASKSVNSKDFKRNCYTMQSLSRQLKENPGLAKKMYDIEYQSRQFIASKKPDGVGNGNGGGNNGGGDGEEPPVDDGLGTITIPVYVYVVASDSQEDISLAQIESQIAVLNADFNDTSHSPEFQNLGADVDIVFTLSADDISREMTNVTDWGLNDAVKNGRPAQPGYLTMWVAPITPGYLGYAQFPGGPADTDGVVMAPQYFGSSDYGNNFYLEAPFDLGRTTTHEVGHWMNLRHIWGDGRCNRDDFVADTPKSDRPNYGCPSSAYHCRSNDMIENYMDYTYDSCMELFTNGQKERMRSVFAPSGPRDNFTGI